MGKIKTLFSTSRLINLGISLSTAYLIPCVFHLDSQNHSSLLSTLYFITFILTIILSGVHLFAFLRNVPPKLAFISLINTDIDELFTQYKDEKSKKINTYEEEELDLKINTQNDDVYTKNPFDELKDYLKAIFIHSNDIIRNLDKLILAKDQMLAFLNQSENNSQQIETKLFLEKDVSRMIESFRDEASILYQMKLNHYPQLDIQKKEFLESMVERIELIGHKMINENEKINASMQEALKEKRSVNTTFLKSKM